MTYVKDVTGEYDITMSVMETHDGYHELAVVVNDRIVCLKHLKEPSE